MSTVPSQEPEWSADRTRVLVVEDAESMRRFLRAVLESTKVFEVVGEADTGLRALEETRRSQPDLILLDLSLPDKTGAQLLPELLHLAPNAKVVVLSNSARLVGPSLMAKGATAYIEKGLPPAELLAALAAFRGGAARSDESPVARELDLSS